MKVLRLQICQVVRMEDNRTGYRKPPKEHQFKKGQSGNPKGRPRKTPDLVSIDDAEIMRRLDGQMTMVRGQKMSWREAEVHRLWELALKGDNCAIGLLEKLRDQLPNAKSGGVRHAPMSHFMKAQDHER